MFYEDIRIGQSTNLGETEVLSREAILAYGKKFDPRIVAQAADGSARLAAAGMHVAAAGMRRLVETRSALRTTRWPSAAKPFRSLACRQVSKTCAGRIRCMRAIWCLVFGGDGVETPNLQAKMGARHQHISRRQPDAGRRFWSFRALYSCPLVARRTCDVRSCRSQDFPGRRRADPAGN